MKLLYTTTPLAWLCINLIISIIVFNSTTRSIILFCVNTMLQVAEQVIINNNHSPGHTEERLLKPDYKIYL
jgi:hypothetical protein